MFFLVFGRDNFSARADIAPRDSVAILSDRTGRIGNSKFANFSTKEEGAIR